MSDFESETESETESEPESETESKSVANESVKSRNDSDSSINSHEAIFRPTIKNESYYSNRNAGIDPKELLSNFKNRVPFLTKLKRTDKDLFITNYATTCDWQYRKQPVVLTKDEKIRIDEIAPDSYKEDSIIEY